jgi:hypothetical protein
MTEIHFTNLLIVVAAAFAAPFLLGLAPRVRLPSVVLEIVAGIVIGPRGARLGRDRRPDRGPEPDRARVPALPRRSRVDFGRLRGPLLRLSALSYVVSFGIAIVVCLCLKAGDLIETPLLVAIILASTSSG